MSEERGGGQVSVVDVGDVAPIDTNGTDSSTVDLVEMVLDVGGNLVPLPALLESLLFVAEMPVEPAQLAQALHIEVAVVERGLYFLRQRYQETGRGLRVQERDGKFLMVTMPAAACVIEEFLSLELSTRLSGPALETLAIIAYRQPVTRAQIEAVRGVDCGGVLKTLLARDLIEEIGRLDAVGRPVIYGVTDLFMQHFGLTSLGELPPLTTDDQDALLAASLLAEDASSSIGRTDETG